MHFRESIILSQIQTNFPNAGLKLNHPRTALEFVIMLLVKTHALFSQWASVNTAKILNKQHNKKSVQSECISFA
jgi:hypothetical protein